MSISQQRRDLFRHPNILDKLALIQTLLDSGELDADSAFALINAVHADLRRPGKHDARSYVRYGEMMGTIHRQRPEVYDGVIGRWEASRLGIGKQDSDESTQELSDESFESDEKEVPVSHSRETLQSVVKAPGITDNEEDLVEIGGGTEEELEVPEAEEEEEETEEVEEKETSEEAQGEDEKAEPEEEEEAGKEENEEEELEEKEEEQEEEKEETEEQEESTEGEREENEAEEKEEAEEESEQEEKEELEETETEEAEEKQEEQEAEKEETETESAGEADQMATEAAEAAEHMEEQEAEATQIEEEPPMGAAE